MLLRGIGIDPAGSGEAVALCLTAQCHQEAETQARHELLHPVESTNLETTSTATTDFAY
jgi:hypothetical protein